MTQYLPYSVLAIMNVAPDNEASCLSAISSARVCRSDGGVPGGPPAFTSRCGRFLTALGSGTPQARLLHPPRSAKVPPRRDVGPIWSVRSCVDRNIGVPGLLAARQPGNFHIRQPPVGRTLRMPGFAEQYRPGGHDKGHLPKGRRTLGQTIFGAESGPCATSGGRCHYECW